MVGEGSGVWRESLPPGNQSGEGVRPAPVRQAAVEQKGAHPEPVSRETRMSLGT